MKKLILAISFLFINLIAVKAQDNLISVFYNLPDAVVSGLNAEMKDLLLANPTDTAEVTVETGVYDSIKRLAIADDYIMLQTSPAGTVQIKLLPLINESKIICVIHTVCAKACDSHISFYTTKWTPIAQSDLFPAKRTDWFIKSDVDRGSQEFRNALSALDMNPMKLTISNKDNSISVEYDIKGYLSEDDYKIVQPFLTEQPKVFTWDKISYK